MPESRLRIIIDASADAAKGELGAIARDLKASGAAASDAAVLQNKLSLALHDTQTASERLSAAQGALTANTDPGAQRELEGEVLKAQVALDQEAESAARAAVDLQTLQQGSEDAADATHEAGISFTEINSVLSISKQAYAAVEGAVRAVIDPTIKYADEVRNLSRTIGATPEDASKLIQAADDVFISTETLTAGLEAAIRKGVKPTIEGLGEIADAYLALPAGIERSKYAMDTFGRSGEDLAPLLEKGSKGIRELGDNAERTGLVMSQQGLNAALKYKQALDDMQDSTLALKMAIAEGLVPAMTQLFSGISKWLMFEHELDEAVKDGALTEEERAALLYKVKNNMDALGESTAYVTGLQEKWNDEIQNQAHLWNITIGAQDKANQSTRALTGAYDSMIAVEIAAGKANEAYAISFERTTAATVLAAGLAGEVTKSQQSYQDVLTETTPKIEEITAKIAKLEAAQGKTVFVNQEASATSADVALAWDKQQVAAGKLADAQRKLSEYTGDNTDDQFKLNMEVDAATVAYENSTDALNKASDASITGKNVTLDYSKTLQNLHADLDTLTAKQLEAKAQLLETTEQFIFQKISAGLDAEQTTILAEKMGLLDPASAEAARAAIHLREAFDKGQISAEEFGVDADELAKAIARLQDKHITITEDHIRNEIINTINNGVIDNRGGGTASGGGANNNNTGGSPGHIDPVTGQWVPGFAGGADFVVPSWYPNDSFPMRVSAGEHVTVTPAGQSTAPTRGGDTYIINDRLTGKLVLEMQRQRAIANAERLM